MQPMDDQRRAAIKRLQAKRELWTHLFIFVAVNTMLVIIWASTGAGYFWPIWPIGGWGVGLAAHAFAVTADRSFTESDIQAEMKRRGPQDLPPS